MGAFTRREVGAAGPRTGLLLKKRHFYPSEHPQSTGLLLKKSVFTRRAIPSRRVFCSENGVLPVRAAPADGSFAEKERFYPSGHSQPTGLLLKKSVFTRQNIPSRRVFSQKTALLPVPASKNCRPLGDLQSHFFIQLYCAGIFACPLPSACRLLCNFRP